MRIKLFIVATAMILMAALLTGCNPPLAPRNNFEEEVEAEAQPTPTTPIPYTIEDWRNWTYNLADPTLDVEIETETAEQSIDILVNAPGALIEVQQNGLVTSGYHSLRAALYFQEEGAHNVTVLATVVYEPPEHLAQWGNYTSRITQHFEVRVDWSYPGLTKWQVVPLTDYIIRYENMSTEGMDGMAVILDFDEDPTEVKIAGLSAFPVPGHEMKWMVVVPWTQIITHESFFASWEDSLENSIKISLPVIRPFNRAEKYNENGELLEVNLEAGFNPSWWYATVAGYTWKIYQGGRLAKVVNGDWTPVLMATYVGVGITGSIIVVLMVSIIVIFLIHVLQIIWWQRTEKKKGHELVIKRIEAKSAMLDLAPEETTALALPAQAMPAGKELISTLLQQPGLEKEDRSLVILLARIMGDGTLQEALQKRKTGHNDDGENIDCGRILNDDQVIKLAKIIEETRGGVL